MCNHIKAFPVSWEELHEHLKHLLGGCLSLVHSKLVAVTRGGLVPAAIVARELEIKR